MTPNDEIRARLEGLEGWDYGGCGWYRGMSAIMRRQAIRAEYGTVTYWELMREGYNVSNHDTALEAMKADAALRGNP